MANTVAIGDQPTMKRELRLRQAVFLHQKTNEKGVTTWTYKTPTNYLLVRKHPTAPGQFSMAEAASCNCD